MNRYLTAAAILAMIPAGASAKKEQAPIDPGPPPASLEEFKRLGEQAMLASFFDPGSAQITWDRAIIGGYWKPVLQGKVQGWWTCGTVNAKNRMGGYVGAHRFVVVERNGQVVFNEVGDGGNLDFVEAACQNAIKNGILPPASAQTAAPPLDPSTPRLGIQFSIVPDGAYLRTIEPGSPAAKAGLVPGMVISDINGLSLKGFDQTTISKLLAASATVTLTIIGKGDVKLTKAVPTP